ncbi:ester cyclase [Streptomyces goshikiensis]|uniref:ester cyclase n=1 Tax=Streptomyces goshikiensis TaxID=1942 RepID=UPI0036B394A4
MAGVGRRSPLNVVPGEPVRAGDTVSARVEPMGVPATGKEARVQHLHVYRIADGQVAEHWAVRDDLELFRQIGAWTKPLKGAPKPVPTEPRAGWRWHGTVRRAPIWRPGCDSSPGYGPPWRR